MKIVLSKALVLAVIVLSIGASIIPSTVGINDTTNVSIDPPSKTVSPGETFTIDVFCVPSQQIKSYELKLSFDPLLLQANSVTEGDIFDGYTTIFNTGTIDNNAGNIVNIYGLIFGSGNVSIPGTLVNISLTAKSTIGFSLLNLYNVGVTNETEYVSIIVNDGNVTIQGENNNPNIPSNPSGPTVREIGQSGIFSTNATDPDGDQVQYRFDWDADGGNDYSSWTVLGASGHTDSLSHFWNNAGTYVVKAQARDEHGYESVWSDPIIVVVSSGENQPPNKPDTPSGPISGKIGTRYGYSSSTIDPDGDSILYRFDWGDGTKSEWLGPHNSGDNVTAFKRWTKQGSYSVKVKAMDSNLEEGAWSDPIMITMPKNKAINPFLFFLERLIDRFPIMEQILQPIYNKLTGLF